MPRVRGESGWMLRSHGCPVPVVASSAFAGFRFPPDLIVLAVRWYLRFGLSYRDVEELLAEHGIEVVHVPVYRWVQRFTPLLVDAARPCRHAVGDRWYVDETYIKVHRTRPSHLIRTRSCLLLHGTRRHNATEHRRESPTIRRLPGVIRSRGNGREGG